jgi:hypothetical protein
VVVVPLESMEDAEDWHAINARRSAANVEARRSRCMTVQPVVFRSAQGRTGETQQGVSSSSDEANALSRRTPPMRAAVRSAHIEPPDEAPASASVADELPPDVSEPDEELDEPPELSAAPPPPQAMAIAPTRAVIESRTRTRFIASSSSLVRLPAAINAGGTPHGRGRYRAAILAVKLPVESQGAGASARFVENVCGEADLVMLDDLLFR